MSGISFEVEHCGETVDSPVNSNAFVSALMNKYSNSTRIYQDGDTVFIADEDLPALIEVLREIQGELEKGK